MNAKPRHHVSGCGVRPYPIAFVTALGSPLPQPTEWENIGNQINAAFVCVRADFVNVDDLNSFDIPLIESFE
jgi:hypothetical protein